MKFNKQLSYLKNNKPSTPCILTDLTFVINQCIKFKKLFPKINLYYAVKAYYDDAIINSIDDYVDGYDVASIGEIKSILSIGVKASRLIYSNPVKAEIDISKAYSLGVRYFAVQSENEVEKLVRVAPGAKIIVRVKIDDEHSVVPLSVKFGCLPEEVNGILTKAQENGLNPYGLTFHVGSQQIDSTAWVRAIDLAQKKFIELIDSGIECTMINIGGGFPAQYQKDDLSLEDIALEVNKIIDLDIEYVAEPGRMIVAESSVLVSTVIGVEIRQNIRWIYLDVGLFQAFIGAGRFKPFPYKPVLYDEHYRIKNDAESQRCILTGPTCDSFDIIIDDAQLPVDIKLGDKIMFPNTGAYTIVYGAEFNGFKVPNKIFINY